MWELQSVPWAPLSRKKYAVPRKQTFHPGRQNQTSPDLLDLHLNPNSEQMLVSSDQHHFSTGYPDVNEPIVNQYWDKDRNF